jgi:hypothetical protein
MLNLSFTDKNKPPPHSRNLPEKLIAAQLVKKLPAFYGDPKVHCCVSKERATGPYMSHVLTPYLSKRFNIILPSTSRSF